jgi:hypothetical protein
MRAMFGGIEAIRAEFEASGDGQAIECMRYVLDRPAVSSDLTFPNSPWPRDCGEGGVLAERRTPSGDGMTLLDFWTHPHSQTAKLDPTHVAALRIYSTAAFALINEPMRDIRRRERGAPHPLPLTTSFLRDGVSKLRSVGAHSQQANTVIDLWRGLRNVEVLKAFMNEGGTELAPMSTTSDVRTAVKYATGEHCTLMRLRTRSSMERGAHISYLSAFPLEDECLFPPLTYLQPVGESTLEIGSLPFRVVTVEPRM